MNPVTKILIDAKNLIEKEGWIKGRLSTSNGYCPLGALIKVFESNFSLRKEEFSRAKIFLADLCLRDPAVIIAL